VPDELDLDAPHRHLVRAAPGWREPDQTECGRPLADVTTVITRDEAKALLNKYGKTRSAFILCQACVLHEKGVTWEGDPIATMYRELESVRYARYTEDGDRRGARREQLTRELRAIATLIAAHRADFDLLMDDLGGAIDLQQKRVARARKNRGRGFTLGN
jgi:hypothetical protein